MRESFLRNSANLALDCLPNTQDFAKPKRPSIKSASCPVSTRKIFFI